MPMPIGDCSITASGNSMGHQVTYVTYFRIGAASDAALRELADAQITLMGRGRCSVSAVYRFPLYGGST